jgi:monoamine oxidase
MLNCNIKNVIVIGAGIAGLKASLDLAKAGIQVTLLEARNRLGGRIYTIQTKDDKAAIELGASYWEGVDENPFYQHYFSRTADDIKAQTLRLDETKSELISLDDLKNQNELIFYYKQAQKLLSSSEVLGAGKTFHEYINQLDLSAFTNNQKYWIKRFLENSLLHHCTPLSKGGFPTFIREKANNSEKWNDEDADFCFVQNGYDKVVQQIFNECLLAGVNIVLNSPVSKIIDLNRNGVEVKSNQNTFKADRVISTIPIGVLKNQINYLFEPCLSKEKIQAIHTIGIHDATRVILEFDGEPFWNNPLGPYIYLDSKELPCLLEFRNAYPLCGKAILLTGKYSDLASTLYMQYLPDKKRAENELVSKILSDLRRAYPNKNIADPINTWVYCWTLDPFSQGAYPYRTANIDEDLQKALERSEGNIYFAGADFSRFGFSVHHAYNKAQQVAKAVIEGHNG